MLTLVHFLFLFCLFLGPIYWLPFVPVGLFLALKSFLFASSICFIIGCNSVLDSRGLKLNSDLKLGLFFIFLCSVLFFELLSGNQTWEVFGFFSNMILLILLLIATSLKPLDLISMKKIVVLIFILSIISFGLGVLSFSGLLTLHSPEQFNALPVYFTGFAGLRTGWSIGLSIYIICILIYLVLSKRLNHKNSFTFVFFCWLSFCLLFVSQIISGGRTGIITSLLAFFSFVLTTKNYKLLFIVLFLSLIGGVYFIDLLIPHLRIDRLFGESAYSNDFSAGRFEQFGLSIEIMLNELATGYKGYLNYFYSLGIEHEIHNVWLSFAVQFGLLSMCLVLFWLCLLVRKVYKKHGVGMAFIICSGLFCTLLEPSALFLSLQLYLLWWALLITLVVIEPTINFRENNNNHE